MFLNQIYFDIISKIKSTHSEEKTKLLTKPENKNNT